MPKYSLNRVRQGGILPFQMDLNLLYSMFPTLETYINTQTDLDALESRFNVQHDTTGNINLNSVTDGQLGDRTVPGSSANGALTASLSEHLINLSRPSSEVTAGLLRTATQEEANAGAVDGLVVSPSKLKVILDVIRTAVNSVTTRFNVQHDTTGNINLNSVTDGQLGDRTVPASSANGSSTTTLLQHLINLARGATTSIAGLVRIATNAEVLAGSSVVAVVTPDNLASRTASTGRTGLISIATQAEVNAGTNTDKAVTPATLSSIVSGTCRCSGVVEFSTVSGGWTASGAYRYQDVYIAGLPATSVFVAWVLNEYYGGAAAYLLPQIDTRENYIRLWSKTNFSQPLNFKGFSINY